MKKQYQFKLYITFLFCMFYQFISAQCEGVSIDGIKNNEVYIPASCNGSRFINLQTPYQNPSVSINPLNGSSNLFYANGSFIFSFDYQIVGIETQPMPVFNYEVLVSDPANSSTQCKFNLHINISPCQQILDLKTTLASCDLTNGSILIKMMNSTKINLIDANTQKVVLSKQYGYGFDFNNYDTLKNLKAGSYKIEAWPDYSNNSNPTQIIYATVNIPENLKIESKYKIVCEGNPLTLSAPSAQKYQWSTGETTQTIQVTKGGKYALEVVNPSIPLCKTKDTIDLKFNPKLTLEVIQSYKDCNSNSLDIIYRVKGGTVPYYIQHGPLGSCFEGCLQKADSVFKGTYWGSGYYVVASDASGCSVAKEYKMLPNTSNLKLSYTKNIKICQGDSIAFNDQYPNVKEFKHQWYLDGQAISQGTKNEFFAKKSGKYHVIVTSPWCEVKSDTITVEEVVPTPIQFVNPFYQLCLGTTVTYQAEKNKFNYEWNILNQTKNIDYKIISGGTDTESSISIEWFTEGPKQISLNYTNGQCKSQTPAIINSTVVAPTFLVSVTPNQMAICQGIESTYKVINSGPNSGSIQPLNLTWDVPSAIKGVDYEIKSMKENEIKIKWLKPAKYNLIVTNASIGSVCGGNNTVVFDITVNPIEKPTIIADKGTVCIGNIIQYSTESNKQNYEWIIPNKTKGTDYLILEGGDLKSNIIKINWLSQGLNEVNVNYTSVSSLCKSEYPASITTQVQMPIELVYITPEKSDVCLNSIATYKVKNLNGPNSGNIQPLNLTWDVPGAVKGVDYEIKSIKENEITIKWLKPEKYNLIVTNAGIGSVCGGNNSVVFDITVNPIEKPTIIADKGMVCIGNIIQYSTESNKQNYEWIIPNKTKGTDYLILEGGDLKSNIIKINWLSQGLNEVTVNYTSVSSLCKSEYPASITTQVQIPIELVHTTPEKSDVCLNSVATYKVKNLNAPYSIMNQQNLIWTVYGDPSRDYKVLAGGNATDSSITVQWLKATKTGIFVNTNNCGNSISFYVTVHNTINTQKLVSELPKNLCNIDSLKLTISNLGTNSIQWYFNDNEISKAIDSFYYAKLPGKYNVVVKNAGNCSFKSDYFEFKKDTCNSSVAKLNIVQEDPILVYPNPASTVLNIDARNTNVTSFSLVNVLGQEVIHSDLQGTKNEINLYQFAKGMYILSFFNEKYEIISSQKISIE